MKQQVKIAIQEILLKELLYSEGGQISEQIAQSGCGVTILRDIQSLTEHGPEQSPLFVLTFEQGFGLDNP